MELLIKPKTGTIRWMDKKTGAYKDTNLSADENLEKITDSEKSDLTVSYFNGKYSELYSTYSTYNSFKMCAGFGTAFPTSISTVVCVFCIPLVTTR